MLGRSLRAALLRSGAAIYPEGACDAEERRALDEEAREGNARVLAWLAVVLLPLCLLTLAIPLRSPEGDGDPARLAWQRGLVRIVGVVIVVGIVPAIVLRQGRPAALRRSLGDVLGSVHLLCAAAMSANSQRAHPNLNVFVIAVLGLALFLRMRPWVFALALAAGGALVIAGVERFQAHLLARHVDELSVVGVCVLAIFASILTRSMRLRVFLARRQVERLNGDLERRVEAQVGEIVRRAQEIDALNDQLNARIKERSRELSMALARLAEGHQALAAGTVLGGRVAIEAWLGAGGMGVVYRGRDQLTGRTVAVKVIQAGSAGELDDLYRFLREAQAMATVTHPAVVRSIHVDVSDEGLLFQMMELVEGEPLDARLARAGPLPPPAVARLGAVLAEGLAAAHAAGVVHRDVKPSNVMLTRTAPGLKLLDFGISKLWDAGATSGYTGRFLGTPEFVSPEQVSDPARAGAPADVYSLGLLLYLCVAGRLPFKADGSRGWLLAHIADDPVELAACVPGVDPALARAVMECLSKDPGARPTAADLAAALSRVAGAMEAPPLEAFDLVGSVPPGPPDRASRTVSRTTGETFRSSVTQGAEDVERRPRTPGRPGGGGSP